MFIEYNKKTGLYTYDEEILLQVQEFRDLQWEFGVRAIHYLWLWCRAGSPVQYIKDLDEKDAFIVQQVNAIKEVKLGQKIPYGLYEKPGFQFAEATYKKLNLDAGSVEQQLYIKARQALEEIMLMSPKPPVGKGGGDPTPDQMEQYLKLRTLHSKAQKETYKELKDLMREMQDSNSGGIWAKGGSIFDDQYKLDDLIPGLNNDN